VTEPIAGPHPLRRARGLIPLVLASAAVLGLSAISHARAQQVAPTPPGPLSKAHSALTGPGNCQNCHVAPGKIAASLCLKCHKPIADRIAAKKGVHREVTDECAACHAEHSGAEDLRPLDPKSFDHAQDAGFPLQGAHLAIAANCARCHTTRSYLGNKPECISCHEAGHPVALGTACGTCHTPTTWKNASRAFHKAGVFVLEGKHLNLACASCHANGVVKGTPTKCYDCHWIRRQDDRYRTRLGSQCDDCHRPISWTAVRWTHAARTGIALNPQHLTLRCDSCHASQAFRAGEVQCVSCHQAEYQRTQNPNHASAGFPTSCDACHRPSDTSFRGAGFNHNATFLLVGVHAAQSCGACHKNNVYRGTPRDCYGCHRADYDRAQNPNHAAAGFPTTCDSCHRPTDPGFRGGGAFNHNSVFQLVGVHATQPCTACHKNNVYRGTPRDCYGCHQADYQRAQNPNHIAAGFPTTCETCHRPTDTSFTQGRFDHTYFPITSGRHAGVACSSCHVDRTNFKLFTCFTCHDRAGTDSRHSGIAGYRYDSQACYTCHPQGRG